MSFALPRDSRLRHPDFLFGVATAAYQVEGASTQDGRTPSIWDTFSREPGRVLNGDNGDIACDHYHRWPQDLDLIQELGFDAYRLSIAWPRIVPERGQVNALGLAFYDRLIDGLLERGIKPVVTLYHWDLPQYLGDRGGWVNRETAYLFAEFADTVSRRLGDRVHAYVTLNEPWCSAFLGYKLGLHAPGLKEPRLGFQAAHHLLLGHGLALPALRANAPNSRLGLTLNFTPNYPASPRYNDHAVALLEDAINSHWFLQPVMEGCYPWLVRQQLAEANPAIYPGDMAVISRPLDFLGVNYYTRSVVRDDGRGRATEAPLQHAERSSIGWEIYPQGMYDLLLGLHRQYTLPPIVITENGAADVSPQEDTLRCRYHEQHLQAIDRAIRDGVDVAGYFAWSLMDNFEWAEGYSQRFGLVHVDYKTQQRTKKRSAELFRQFLAERTGAEAQTASAE
ncbi:beta-glucosidase [Alkalilimnicola ehrlichii]|uniref:Beta-glucosidase n=1 Tax=Alkalilimnicola ehrlichii TaxID=351052 RepID=A0A3E0WTQ3_9GAMM|nr:GH1 family beta-glucosidase [Alkalilimnicola ehrlichii]RFA28605.1 beta-glucosidase [Alkalilimnicola ehrlichii]RFA35769.1 beta-glucosidase [Alkalilimnicola ehrlichii]